VVPEIWGGPWDFGNLAYLIHSVSNPSAPLSPNEAPKNKNAFVLSSSRPHLLPPPVRLLRH